MASYPVRLCAVGTEADMQRLLRVLLRNWGDDGEDQPADVAGLVERVNLHATQNSASSDQFLYEMVAPRYYGDGVSGTLRLSVRPAAGNLMTATFAWDSEHPFQAHDWLDLHKRSGGLPMLAMRAGQNFGAEKGMVLFAGQNVEEDWNLSEEIWLWLTRRETLCGIPPVEAVAALKALTPELEEEFCDRTALDILSGLEDYLGRLEEALRDEEALAARLAEARERRDFETLFQLMLTVAQGALWEMEHIRKWEAALRAIREAAA